MSIPMMKEMDDQRFIAYGWTSYSLGDLGSFFKGAGIRRDQAQSGTIPCVRYGEIYTSHHNIIRDFYSHISCEVSAVSTRLKSGDLLFAGSGETKEEIGKCVAFVGPEEAFAGGDIIILRPKGVNSAFLGYLLNTPEVVRQKASRGQGDAVVHISAAALGSIQVELPRTEEQGAIADALCDIDDLVASLDALIAKKRDIKQAAMQQLLTGKTRLPGFKGNWVSTRLGGIVQFFKGRGLPKAALNTSGSAPCIHYGELFTHYGPRISIITSRTFETESATLSRANDVLMPTSDVTPRGLAKASCVLLDDVIIGGDALIIRPSSTKLDGVFLANLIRQSEAAVLNLVRGSTVFHIYATDLSNLELHLPKVEEQIAIAEVLTDMDRELEQLTVKRAKAASLKEGMMRQLLTGRIRLI